jgi:mono/diheme cytochrome c family protein
MVRFARAAVVSAVLLGAVAAVAHAGDGAALFAQNCAICHQAGATGLPGQFPRLAGRVARIARKAEGRAYLIDIITYGMAGEITVDKAPIMGVMPPLPLSDDDVALVLSFVASLQSAAPMPITAAEVAAERARPRKSSAEVLALRHALQQSKLIE